MAAGATGTAPLEAATGEAVKAVAKVVVEALEGTVVAVVMGASTVATVVTAEAADAVAERAMEELTEAVVVMVEKVAKKPAVQTHSLHLKTDAVLAAAGSHAEMGSMPSRVHPDTGECLRHL